jgi:hypothetical protein
MGLRPTQGDENRPLSGNRSSWKLRPPLCHPEQLTRGASQECNYSVRCVGSNRRVPQVSLLRPGIPATDL